MVKASGFAVLALVFLLVACSGAGARASPREVSPTLPPSGAEVGAGPYKVGDTVSFSSHSVTVNSVEHDDLLVVNVTFRNTSPRDFDLKPERLFDAFDAAGNRLDFHPQQGPNALPGALAKGQTLTGNIYFEIRPGQKVAKMQYHASQMGLMLAGSVEFIMD